MKDNVKSQGKFTKNWRIYKETEGNGGVLQCQRPFGGDLHPRYEPKEAYAEVYKEIPGAVPVDR